MGRTRAAAERDDDVEDVRLPIRPQVGMYSAFSRLNYKAWYAIAEFVDNAVQSFLANKARIAKVDGKRAHLRINIEVASDQITISDNAAGIGREDLVRAFTPAQPPPDDSGLSEFGLGMKAASCWFARRWQVRTKALGERVERTVSFDVNQIIGNGIEVLVPSVRASIDPSQHYTTIVLEDLNVRPQTRTLAKIRSHLASIYRHFIRNGDIEIYFNEPEPLTYEEPELLTAPFFKTPKATPVLWKKDILIELDDTHRITGWAGLRETGNYAESGFAVFRRKRLIQGSVDETYRPEQIFGSRNSFESLRLCGELHVEGFKVSHTKDGLHWEEWEEQIVEELHRQLKTAPLPLIEQAHGHKQARSRKSAASWGHKSAVDVASTIGTHAPPVIQKQIFAPPPPGKQNVSLPPAKLTASEMTEFEVTHAQKTWRVRIEVADEPQMQDWFSYSHDSARKKEEELTIRLNLAHPFSERFGLNYEQDLDPLLRIAAGFALAEITAIMGGTPALCKRVRRNFNDLLRNALCK
jgi:hypothetical protein